MPNFAVNKILGGSCVPWNLTVVHPEIPGFRFPPSLVQGLGVGDGHVGLMELFL